VKAWRGLAGYSIWTWLLSLAVLLRDRSESLMLGRLANLSSVGFYAVGAEIAALPTTELIEPIGRAAFSGFAAARQATADVGETYLRLIGSAALLTLPAGVGLSLVAAPLVTLAFGAGWEQAVPVLRILSLSATAMVLGHLSQHLLSAHALLGRLVGITLAGAAVRIVLLALLIPPFGLTGAALAAGTAVLLEQFVTVATALRRFHVSTGRLFACVWRPAAGVIVMALVLGFTRLGWSDNTGLLVLVEGTIAGAVTYILTLVACWQFAGRPAGAETDILAMIGRSAA
jgi:O-antigen/teichoic acid export membrane protein